jgi:hypothetical protein
MNITNRDILKNWFIKGAKPLASQFAVWIDSFVHKEDNIPASKVEGLQAVLDAKADKEALDNTNGTVQGLRDDFDTATDDLSAGLSGKEDKNKKGVAGGYAELDSAGKVPSAQLPAFMDDVIELTCVVTANPGSGMTVGAKYYNSTTKKIFTANSATSGTVSDPESDKVYVNMTDNKTYRWSGSDMVIIGSDLALGETESTAYRGDRGKTAYNHSQATGNPHGATATDVGAAPSSHVGSGGTTQHPLATDSAPGFSSRDFTATEKTKLSGIAEGATKVTVEDSFTSDSTTNAPSAARVKALYDELTSLYDALTWG